RRRSPRSRRSCPTRRVPAYVLRTPSVAGNFWRHGPVYYSGVTAAEESAMQVRSIGHAVFAAVLIGIGVLGLVKSEYAAIWAGMPKDLPARGALLQLSALLSIACGLGLLWPRSAAPAARVWLAWFLAWTLLFKGRFVLLAP